MKRFVYLSALILAPFLLRAAERVEIPQQTIEYKADYHYGFIKITAGIISINLNLCDNNFSATLNGTSVPIGGHSYAVSDTLRATMTPTETLSQETVTYANGWYAKPQAGRSATVDFANPARFKNTMGGGYLDASDETMEAISISTDMLAVFYYFRQMDFDSMTPGHTINLAIALPEGKSQNLDISFEGVDSFEGVSTYKATFNFSYNGSATPYPITAWIDPLTRLPLMLSAELRIGHIELRLENGIF